MAKNVVVNFIGNDKLSRVTEKATSGVDKFQKGVKEAGHKMDVFASVPIAAFLTEATHSALDWRRAMSSLDVQVHAATGHTIANTRATEEWLKKIQYASGFVKDQVATTYGRFINVLKDEKKAQEATAFAADFARAKHIDLETATTALLGAESGRTGALRKLGVATKDASGHALTLTQIIDRQKASVKGAGEAYVEGAGKSDVMKLKLHDLSENVGGVLIPIIDKLSTWLGKVADWFDHLSGGQKQFVIDAALVVAAVGPALSIFSRLLTLGKGVGSAIRGIGSAFKFATQLVPRLVTGLEEVGTAETAVATAGLAAAAAIGALIGKKLADWINRSLTAAQNAQFQKDLKTSVASVYKNASTANLLKLAKIPGFEDASLVKAELHSRHVPGFGMAPATMPGPRGVPGLAILHGGEKVSSGDDGGVIELHVHIGEREIVRTIQAGLLKRKRNSLSLGLA